MSLSEKKTSNLGVLEISKACPLSLVNACWVSVQIRRVLHYDASSCMKVYFKESLQGGVLQEGGRGLREEVKRKAALFRKVSATE